MTEAARRRTRARIRLIKIQWLLILALIVALIISFVTRPSASVPDEPESSPVRVEAPEPITETAAPEPKLTELGEFKTTAYCTCVKCCGKRTPEWPVSRPKFSEGKSKGLWAKTRYGRSGACPRRFI